MFSQFSATIYGYRNDDCWSASKNNATADDHAVYRTDSGRASVNFVYSFIHLFL